MLKLWVCKSFNEWNTFYSYFQKLKSIKWANGLEQKFENKNNNPNRNNNSKSNSGTVN